ncbi:MAG: hypothetical protein AAFY03_06035 [Pseudomonadota bacterium]
MRDRDDDLRELEGLLGHTVADYKSLRHRTDLAPDATLTSASPRRRLALAASLVAGASLLTILAVMSEQRDGENAARFSMPDRVALPHRVRVQRPRAVGLTVARPNVAIRARLPRSLLRSEG